MKSDIKSDEDIKLLIDTFYSKVNKDEILSPVFNDIAKINWEEHLPIMYSFWSTILFATERYKGDAFSFHKNLPINKKHFERWVKLFKETVDNNFSGEKAEEIKVRVDSMNIMFQKRLGLMSFIDVPKKN